MICQKVPQGDGIYAVMCNFYDGVGNLIKTVDPEGYVTINYYSERGFLQAVEQVINSEQSNIVKYEYDGEGNMTAQITGLSSWTDTVYAKRTYKYDAFGRVVKEKDASGRVTGYTYDLKGNQKTKTDRNGVTSYYTYDGLNRIIKEYNSKDGESAAAWCKYDLNGGLLKSGNVEGTTTNTYDSIGRVVRIQYSSGITKEYTYDKAGRVASLTVKQGSVTEESLTYTYDITGRLALLVSNGVRFTYTYDVIGQLIGETNGLTGINTEYAYNPSGTLRYLRNYKAGELINNYEYEYDLRSHQTKKDEDGVVTEYVYDALGRLKTAVLPNNKVQDYKFDDYSNITKMVEMTYHYIRNTIYYYDLNNRLLMMECKNSCETIRNYYEYDDEGNRTGSRESINRAFGTTTSEYMYYYNGKNQLVTVVNPSGTIYTYTYDVAGMRNSKESSAETVNYFYESGYIILETDANGAITAKNIWGFKLLYREVDETKYGYIFNGHGDIIALTDTNGNVLEDYSYDPYGREDREENRASATFIWEADTSSDTFNNPFRYCGEYYDLETNTYYLRARYYDPSTGRFLSEDSYRGSINEPLSLNLYILH